MFRMEDDAMKVTRITINNRRDSAVSGERSMEHQLLYFRTPAIFRIQEKDVTVNGRSVMLCSRESQRSFRPSSAKGIRYDIVTVNMNSSDKQYIESMNIPFDRPIELSDDYVISSMLRSMSSHIMHKSLYQSEFMELSMRLILIAISENCHKIPSGKVETIPRYSELKALRDAIYDDPMNHWSAEEMSEDMGISRPYFHRLYQSAFGVTCRQDIIESRLIYASELLRNTDMSISVIAETCGYDSDAYFMRQFKQHKGCTPSEYRRRAAANGDLDTE